MIANPPILSIHHVAASGAIELVAANVPYTNLQWTRRFSTVGEFSVQLACPCPVPLPGRYLLTLSDHREVGVYEKDDSEESSDGSASQLSGRFAECLWDRYRLGPGGESARGANWRQAVTSALAAWHMGDLPPLAMGSGTEGQTGSSYAISGDAGSSAMELMYSSAYANGASPYVTYNRDADASVLVAGIFSGTDRTRTQQQSPWCVFSLELASALKVSRSADYSVACSVVVAHAERDKGNDGTVIVTRDITVPGFDADTMWRARAYEDVSSLIGSETDPTAQLVDEAGGLRAYDHMPELAVDCTAIEAGYRSWWDLGDIVEVEMPSIELVAESRIEEVREVYKDGGLEVEATVGNRRISRVKRALMGRR